MKVQNIQQMRGAIKEAINVLEYIAYRNGYQDLTEHKELIIYLQNVCAELKKEIMIK